MKRRILHEIVIDKIAAVDHPCQEGAKMAILKRAEAPDAPEQETDMSAAFEKAMQARANQLLVERASPATTARAAASARREAMEKAALENPELVEAYRQPPAPAPVPEEVAKAALNLAKASRDFDIAVDEIAKRKDLPRSDAMELAASQYPKLYAAYQAA